MSAVWVYVTASDAAEAEKLGRAVVEARLAACANILGPTTAIYWWEGEVESGQEVALVLKSRHELVPAITEKIVALHSYDCPCVVALPISGGNADFLQWLEDETGK
jgi:periplasmic divalent cation tolerance protein